MQHKLVRQLARFVVVGISSVAIDLTIYILLGNFSPLSTNAAKGVSYLSGMIVGFWGNKLWTFQSERRAISELVIYAFIYAFSFVVNIGINQQLLEFFGTDSRLIAVLIATAATTILNFCGMKLIAFRGCDPPHSAELPKSQVTGAPESETLVETSVVNTARRAA